MPAAMRPPITIAASTSSRQFETPLIMATFKAILEDFTNKGFDPFAAPDETGSSWVGKKNGSNDAAIDRQRQACKRMPGLPGDAELRTDANGYPGEPRLRRRRAGQPVKSMRKRASRTTSTR
jgi:hypothetical protein